VALEIQSLILGNISTSSGVNASKYMTYNNQTNDLSISIGKKDLLKVNGTHKLNFILTDDSVGKLKTVYLIWIQIKIPEYDPSLDFGLVAKKEIEDAILETEKVNLTAEIVYTDKFGNVSILFS